MEKHKLRGSYRKREGCWLQRRKLRVQCKGENIPFPLMSKGESTEKGGYLQKEILVGSNQLR
jgi:hypothetical protein